MSFAKESTVRPKLDLSKLLKPLKGHRTKRDRLNRAYSLVADSEVTPGSLEVWSDLPEEIKNDPSLAPFKNLYEKQFGSAEQRNNVKPSELNDGCLQDTSATANQAPNGVPAQHKCTSENNNIAHTNNISSIESGLAKLQHPYVPQNTDYAKHQPNAESQQRNGGEKIFSNNQQKVHDQHNQAKVSFLSSNLLETSTYLTNNPHKPHGQPNGGHEPSGTDDTDAMTGHEKPKPWITNIRIAILLVVWVVFTVILLLKNEKEDIIRQISIPINSSKSYYIFENPTGSKMLLKLKGPFIPDDFSNYSMHWVNVWVDAVQLNRTISPSNISLLQDEDIVYEKTISTMWEILLVSGDNLDFVPNAEKTMIFDLEEYEKNSSLPTILRVMMESNIETITPVSVGYNMNPIDVTVGICYATVVLLGLYILIIFEIVHRTFAAMLASTMSLAILAILGERPTTAEVISWIDVETLLLLFAMMVIVAILSETGIFDYLAVYAYKVTAGRVWPLINCLCIFTAVVSSFLDNVTTVLLMTPVTIRLCEVMELNPVPILMSMIIYSNVGGTLTPVGDPPNVIIASNSEIRKAGIDFTTFTMHMSFGVLLVGIQTYIQLRLYFRNINSLRYSEPQEVRELRHEISIWQRAAASLSSYSRDEDLVREALVKKVNRLLAQLKKKVNSGKVETATYKANLQELSLKYPIRDRVLLVKCAIALLFLITFFFLHSIPELQRLSLGWTALLGAVLLLILADKNDMEAILARVEWSTLLFFAALFILMEALSKLGLIDWIGKQTELIIMSVSEESRLAVAILLILWVSAIASAFVDNIPLTTMMIRIAISLGNNPALNLPLTPLIWALAFGACLGGNGTLIGASANVVCAGVAEQHGYRFTFMEYFKVGFPVMLGSITVITGYLLVCHVALEWH
ncbi:P protein-like isoform X2 [Arctopsyche grandis]|uniref:P protein-like isoform X2 n=1 Tax=Arctopsyche grandis TaxID=121162 RepID=UPI00406D8FD1